MPNGTYGGVRGRRNFTLLDFAVELCSRRFFYFKSDKNRAKFGAKFKKWLKIGVFALQGTNWYPEVLESKLESFLSDFCVII